MDFPFQLKFFKKLEFFQTLKRLDRQFNRMIIQSESPKATWELEKKILRWTYLGHKHLGTPLDPERYDKRRAKTDPKVKKDIEDIGATIEEVASGRNTYALQNLVIRGFATLASKRSYHLYKRNKEYLTFEKGVYDGIQGENKASGNSQDIKGGIYISEDGLIMGELLAEISDLHKLRKDDPYHKKYNAEYKLRYYFTAFLYFELLIWTAWSLIFSSLIIILGQASDFVGLPHHIIILTAFIKPVLQYFIILPLVFFTIAFIFGFIVQIAQHFKNNC